MVGAGGGPFGVRLAQQLPLSRTPGTAQDGGRDGPAYVPPFVPQADGDEDDTMKELFGDSDSDSSDDNAAAPAGGGESDGAAEDQPAEGSEVPEGG